jgi:hypothetical protein
MSRLVVTFARDLATKPTIMCRHGPSKSKVSHLKTLSRVRFSTSTRSHSGTETFYSVLSPESKMLVAIWIHFVKLAATTSNAHRLVIQVHESHDGQTPTAKLLGSPHNFPKSPNSQVKPNAFAPGATLT